MNNSKTEKSALQLPERSSQVLGDIVELYTETGQPVGSKALTEKSKLGLSSASFRNIMSDLEKGGYLASPHTSAGRVPTEAGYRYFAKALVDVEDLDERLKKAVQEKVHSGKPLKQMLSDVSILLEQMTGCASLVASPTLDTSMLEQIEFIRLSGDKVLAVLVTKDGDVENRIIDVPSKVSVESLNESAKHLKEVVAGKTVNDARVLMMQKLMEHKRQVDNLMDDMMSAAETFGEAPSTDSALVLAGTNNLFQYPELVREQLKELFQTFEEKRLLMALINEVQKGKGVQIFVGSDCPFKAAKDCALITKNYRSENKKVIGTIGVLGPMRMNYKKTIQLVDYTGRLITRAIEESSEELKKLT